MGKKIKDLTHTEIWDDSALLQSWDDALVEYKHYHSMHARGERAEDVVEDSGMPDEVYATSKVPLAADCTYSGADHASAEDLEDGELEEATGHEAEVNGDSVKNGHSLNKSSTGITHSHSENVTSEQRATPGVPIAVTNTVQDGALKNLMMSWYYAGFYTGLYEGQQQAHNGASR